MHKPTFDVDAASILFNLSGYRVVSATPGVGVEQPRQVLIETTTSEGACPSCGVLSSRIQARPTQRVKDVARRYAKGRIVSCLEGGYVMGPLARSVEAHLRVLADL